MPRESKAVGRGKKKREAIARDELAKLHPDWDLEYMRGLARNDIDSCIRITTFEGKSCDRDLELTVSESDIREAVRTIVETLEEKDAPWRRHIGPVR